MRTCVHLPTSPASFAVPVTYHLFKMCPSHVWGEQLGSSRTSYWPGPHGPHGPHGSHGPCTEHTRCYGSPGWLVTAGSLSCLVQAASLQGV